MHLLPISLLLIICVAEIAYARAYHRSIERRSGSIVSVYDRNCFFSPIACHFLNGRRAMTFITPTELEQEQRFHRPSRQNENRENPSSQSNVKQQWLFSSLKYIH